ncbi:glycerol-3-phosphate dehydrogenase [NAD(+)], cytoplasmic-like [Argonauta hians]
MSHLFSKLTIYPSPFLGTLCLHRIDLANCLKDKVCFAFLFTSFNLLSIASHYHSHLPHRTHAVNMALKRVCIIGSGNWGSAIAKIAGKNVMARSNVFVQTINMYMYEEMYEGQKLTEIFNTTHENKKYLPGIKISENVVAVPDLLKAIEAADILIFVLPHQFISGICNTIKGKIKPGAVAVSLIKGFDVIEGGLKLLSDIIAKDLGIECAVLMGANLANEVASEEFCESTIGTRNKETGILLKNLFDSYYFRCSVVEDVATVEACGALKNIVAIGAGITDGHQFGANTKAAILRIGMIEMVEFIKFFFKESNLRTYFESCGLADLVTTCVGGRNRRLGEALASTTLSVPELETGILKGQSFQGPLAAKAVYEILESKNMLDKFPLFVGIHLVCERKMQSSEFLPYLMDHLDQKEGLH